VVYWTGITEEQTVITFRIDVHPDQFDDTLASLADYDVTLVSYDAPVMTVQVPTYDGYVTYIDCQYGPIPDDPNIYII
jgi:hypothetical protein